MRPKILDKVLRALYLRKAFEYIRQKIGIEPSVYLVLFLFVMFVELVNTPRETRGLISKLLLPLLVLLIILLIKLVFGYYPFERFYEMTNPVLSKKPGIPPVGLGNGPLADLDITEPYLDSSLKVEEYLKALADESKELSNRVYKRSAAYLFFGCFIAAVGVVFFYTQTQNLIGEKDLTTVASSFAPRFGILFFIELVAFFFLKQYRITMDEFRYYEAIARQRQSYLATFHLSEYQKYNPGQCNTLIAALSISQSPDKLSKEETTELLESRKLSSEEITVLQKLIGAIKHKAQ